MNSVVTWEGQKIQSSRGNPHRTRTNCGLTATHEVHQRVDLKFCLLKSIQVQVHAPLWLRLAGHFLTGQNLVARVQLCCSWDGSHLSVCASLHFQWRNLQESYSCGILQKKHGSDDEVAYNTCCSYEYLRLSPLPKVLCSWKLCWPPRMPGTHWQTAWRGVKPRSEKKTRWPIFSGIKYAKQLAVGASWAFVPIPGCTPSIHISMWMNLCMYKYIYISTAIWNKGQMSGCIYQSTSFKKSPTQL